MGRKSARAIRGMGTEAFQTSQGLINQLTGYAKRPLPAFREEEATGYMSSPELLAGQVIKEILEGGMYGQPGVKSRFAGAIEAPIMDFLRKETMPQIAASAGKGGTYFSTMRGEEEIGAMEDAAAKIAELEGGYILNAMGQAIPASLAYGGLMQERWQRMQPEWGGGTVPLIQEILKSAVPMAQTGMQAAEQYEAIASQERQARMAGITSGFGSAMGAGGQVGGAAMGKGGACGCKIFTEDWTRELESRVRKFRDEHFVPSSYVSEGYNHMSKWLVPKMLKNKFVRWLARKIMLKPMSKFAEHTYNNKDLKGLIYAPISLFWVLIWEMLGRLDGEKHLPSIRILKI